MNLSRILVIIAMAFVATLTVAAVDLLFAPVEDGDETPQAAFADLYDPGMRGVMQRIGLLPTRHELRRELGVEGDGGGAVDVAAARPAGGMAAPDGAGSPAPTAAAPPESAIAGSPAAADARASASARSTEATEPATVPDPGGAAAREEPAAGADPDALPAPREIARTAAEPGDAASPADAPTASASREESPPAASATVSPEDLAAEAGIDPDAVVPPDSLSAPVASAPADVDADSADGGTISLEELAAEVGIDPDAVVPSDVIDGTAVPLAPDGSGEAAAGLPPVAESPAAAAPAVRDRDSAADDDATAGTISLDELAAEVGIDPDAVVPPDVIDGTAVPLASDGSGNAAAGLPPAPDSAAAAAPAGRDQDSAAAGGTISLEELAAEVGIDPDAVVPPDVIDGTAVPLAPPDGSGEAAAGLPPVAETPVVAATPTGHDQDSAAAGGTISLEELAAEAGIDPDAVVPPDIIDGTAVPLTLDGDPDAAAGRLPPAVEPPVAAGPADPDADSADGGTISLEELAAEAGIDPDAVEPPFDDAALPQPDAGAAPTAQPGDTVPAETSGVAADPDAGRGDAATGAVEATSDAGDEAPEPAESGDASIAAATEEEDEDSIDPFEIAAVDPGDTAASGPATSPADQAATGAPSLAVTPDGEAAADPLAPTYDLVRFERSGDGLVAGHAAPNARIELFAGDDLVGQTDSGANGDWLIVLERPLAPGDHRLTVRATRPGAPVLAGAQAIALTIDGGAEPTVELVAPAPTAPD